MARLTGAAANDAAASPLRLAVFGGFAALLLVALAARLVQVQIVDGHQYAARAAEDRTTELAVPAPRGLLFDRTGRPVAVNAPSWTVAIRPADLAPEQRSAVLRTLADLTGVAPREVARRLDSYPGAPIDPVPVVTGLDRPTALLVAERAEELPGVELQVRSTRRYLGEDGAPDGNLLGHITGYTGRVDEADLERLAGEGYLPDDVIGRTGIEAWFEGSLRGVYGARLAERDASGRVVEIVDTLAEPQPGVNLMLTIDARMQRLATQALGWGMEVADVSHGVTVVMNPRTGQILAMVSLPGHDANSFASGIGSDEYESYLADTSQPLRNHAISDIYPPGSTFKLVTAIAALEEGVTTTSQLWPTYACFQLPGVPAGECLHEWNRQGFGPLSLVDAFAHSSDTFFYQQAIELGTDSMARWAAELGFGEPTGIELPGEESGTIASTDWLRSQGRGGLFVGELAQVGIGQSVVATTPLQVLNAYAAVANGGRLLRPTVVRGEADASGALINEHEPQLVRELAASDATLETMRIAGREVIASGHAYNIRDLPLPGALSGKTGTAEFGQPDENGSLPFHSWFVAWLPSSAGATDAELAIVTFSYGATVPGNVSIEVVKYLLQLHFGLTEDLRLDPNDFSLVAGN